MNQLYYLYNDARLVFEPPDDEHSYFFGYYDKSPFDITDTLLLSHRTNFDGRPITAEDVAEVGYWNIETQQFTKIGTTRAFNWQQGSHLQWMPPDYKSRIIYNDRRGDQFVSVIYNLDSGQEAVYPCPIYAVHPSGQFALAANYERLYFCRPGYNYMGVVNEKWNVPIHDEDGIYKLDFQTGEVNLLIRTRDVVNFAYLPELEKCDNWLEHIMWNPSGTRFLFFHRWRKEAKDISRFFTADAQGANIYMYPDVGFYSHYYWVNDGEFIVWSLEPKNLNQAKYKIFKKSAKSILYPFAKLVYKATKKFVDPNGKLKANILPSSKLLKYKDQTYNYSIIGDGFLSGNGHTSYLRNEIYLNDTYHNENTMRHLQIIDNNKHTLKNIGSFYSYYNDSVYRCDLHPRVSNQKNLIAIDSAHRKNRKLLAIWSPDVC